MNNHFGPAAGMYEHHEGMGLEVFLTQFGSMFNLHKTFSGWSRRDRADAARAIGVFKNLRHYLNRDFWSLFPQPDDRKGWDGWQFHDPDTGTGLLMFFKRRDCRRDTETIELRWPADGLGGLSFGSVLGEATVEDRGANHLSVKMPGKAALLRYDNTR